MCVVEAQTSPAYSLCEHPEPSFNAPHLVADDDDRGREGETERGRGNTACQACPPFSTTLKAGAASLQDCVNIPGYKVSFVPGYCV